MYVVNDVERRANFNPIPYRFLHRLTISIQIGSWFPTGFDIEAMSFELVKKV